MVSEISIQGSLTTLLVRPYKCVEMACVMMLMLDALAVSMLEAMSMPRDTPVGAVI